MLAERIFDRLVQLLDEQLGGVVQRRRQLLNKGLSLSQQPGNALNNRVTFTHIHTHTHTHTQNQTNGKVSV